MIQKVSPHVRAGRPVARYTRVKRAKAKKTIVAKKPVKMYPVYNEYHERLGWSLTPPKKK